MAESTILDAVVVGAGWAGLAVSQSLQQRGLRHRVLERGRIGETWRSQRWDSFYMNTPNLQTVMPGDRYEGPDPEGAMSGSAFVAMLEAFAARNVLPVSLGTPVTALITGADRLYHLATPGGTLRAYAVAVASGDLIRPRRPALAAGVTGLHQIDAADYRNAAALPEGGVLVVGSAQTGAQIAADLATAGRPVLLSASRVGRVPRRYRGRDIGIWLVLAGLFDAPRQAFTEPSGHVVARPTLGALRTISLQSLSADGVTLLGRLMAVEAGHLHFADDLAATMRFADEASTAVKRSIDDYIARTGINAPPPEPDPAETVAPRLPDPPIHSLDPAACGISTVIWCTGFSGDYGWIRLPGALDPAGRPIHDSGISPLPGLCFAGLDRAPTRRSGTILAAALEAPRLAEHIAAHAAAALRGEQPGRR